MPGFDDGLVRAPPPSPTGVCRGVGGRGPAAAPLLREVSCPMIPAAAGLRLGGRIERGVHCLGSLATSPPCPYLALLSQQGSEIGGYGLPGSSDACPSTVVPRWDAGTLSSPRVRVVMEAPTRRQSAIRTHTTSEFREFPSEFPRFRARTESWGSRRPVGSTSATGKLSRRMLRLARRRARVRVGLRAASCRRKGLDGSSDVAPLRRPRPPSKLPIHPPLPPPLSSEPLIRRRGEAAALVRVPPPGLPPPRCWAPTPPCPPRPTGSRGT